MKKIECPKCKFLISSNGFKAHERACNGKGPLNHPTNCIWGTQDPKRSQGKKTKCPECGKEVFEMGLASHRYAAHSRDYVNGMTGKIAWNKGLNNKTNEILREMGKNISFTLCKLFKEGKIKKSVLSKETREKISKRMSERAQNGQGWSKGSWSVDSFGKPAYLQSSYEVRFSEILKELKINWVRPKSFEYEKENGLKSFYTPDFYLIDHNLFVDTKNKFLAKIDDYKISKVRETHGINLEVIVDKDINKDYLLGLF